MDKLVYTFLFILIGTLARAQGQAGARAGTSDSAQYRRTEASRENGMSTKGGTGKLTVIDATQGELRVFSDNGTGKGSWVSGSRPTVVYGALPANWVTLTSHTLRPNFVNSGMSITLTPGKWLVHVNATYLNKFNRGMNVWWDLSTSNTTNTQLGRALSSAAPTGSYMPVTATYTVQPATTTTYYLWVATGAENTAGVSGLAAYAGEGRIYALPVN